MLIDICKLAKDEWQDFTARDLEILAAASLRSAAAAAEIARSMGHVDVANEILERAMHP